MQNGFLILISVLSFSANSLMTRTFQVKVQKSPNAINVYQSLFCSVAAIIYLVCGVFNGGVFALKLLLPAVVFGVCFALAVLFSAKCMEMGYMSISGVIINLSLILPVMFSWFVLGEKIELNAVIGLILIIITLIVSSLSAKGSKNASINKWLLFVSIAFVCNGVTAITQKQYIVSEGKEGLMLFMGVAYATGGVIFALYYTNGNKGQKIPITGQITNIRHLLVLAIVSGIGSFGGNGILGYLSNKVNGGILYPCINGGLCVATAFFSFVFFKEGFTLKKAIAILMGISAIIILNIKL